MHKFPESHFTMKDPPLYFDSLQKNLNKTDMMEIHCVDEFDNVSGDFNDGVVTQVLITELSWKTGLLLRNNRKRSRSKAVTEDGA